MSAAETGEITGQVDEMDALLDELEDLAEDSGNERVEGLADSVRSEAYDLMDDLDRVQAGWQTYDRRMRGNVDEWIERLEGLRNEYEGSDSGFNQFNYQQNNFWGWNSQPWGNMWQMQGGHYQSMGWGGMHQGQNMYGQGQQQDWFDDFWTGNTSNGFSEEDHDNNSSNTVSEDETYERENGGIDLDLGEDDSVSEDEDYDDGGIDMNDSWNPDASFNYEAQQETNGATQGFNFSGSGVAISGSVTMEQSIGDDHQYFEASF